MPDRPTTGALSPGLVRIVSGGQTGVDRAALDAALAAGVDCGGWCPRGRRAEDGPIAPGYPLDETDSEDYRVRTRQNVADSDATVIIYFAGLFGGTAKTRQYCRQLQKPCLLLDGSRLSVTQATADIARFRAANNARSLNFAGPRASGEPRAYAYTRQVLGALLQPATAGGTN